MKKLSEQTSRREQLRDSIIGLGERSIRKSYYPELQKRIAELEEANEKLLVEVAERRQAQAEQKRLETLLQHAQKMEAIGTLAGGIAHDFNNILSAIIGYTELAQISVQKTEFPEKNKIAGDLGQVLLAGQRAKELIKQILAYSRQNQSRQEPVHLHTIIKEALQLLRSSIPKSVEIRENIVDNHTLALADPTQIHQIVMNLCANANHAMREKGGVLSVELSHIRISKEDRKIHNLDLIPGPYLLLKISDTGNGIPQAIQQRIFDPYFTTKKPEEGTGMGLAVVYGIVKSHGGYISVYSQPDQGSSFSVYLPQQEKDEPESSQMRETEIPTGDEHILVIDDESALAQMERRLLEGLGYKVTSVTNPLEALRIISDHPRSYDLVLTDMTMPVMNGAELAQHILEIRADMPIILCTGFSELIDEKKARSMGIKAYVMKPLIRWDIATAIRKSLDS